MLTIVHLSDLHFGRETPGAVPALEAAIDALKPSLCVISGDFTMRGRPAEFSAAVRFMARLPAPVFTVQGNHDFSYYSPLIRMFQPYHRYRRAINDRLEPTWVGEVVAVFGVGTPRPYGPVLNWAQGDIADSQITSLSARIQSAGQPAWRVVVQHHPFTDEGGASAQHRSMRDPQRAARALERYRAFGVDLVLSGHTHRFRIECDGRADRRLILATTGTATCNRLRGQLNTFSMLTFTAAQLTITPWRFDGAVFAPEDSATRVFAALPYLAKNPANLLG
jgi:3',5'-cyclic AMP phosphodiesterase CpdA